MGDGIDRRNGRRWAAAGYENQFPLPAHTLQSWTCAGTESYDLVFATPAGQLPQVCRESRHRYERAAIRERLAHAWRVGRRWRDCLLRFTNAHGKADAVLWRARESRKVSPLCHKRRPRRAQWETNWTEGRSS